MDYSRLISPPRAIEKSSSAMSPFFPFLMRFARVPMVKQRNVMHYLKPLAVVEANNGGDLTDFS